MNAKRLMLNEDETEIMFVVNKNKLKDIRASSSRLGFTDIAQLSTVTKYGVYLDSKLKMEKNNQCTLKSREIKKIVLDLLHLRTIQKKTNKQN